MTQENKSLALLVRDVAVIEEELILSGGEITPAIEQLLAEIDVKLPEKVESYAGIIARMKLASDFYLDRAEQMQKFSSAATKIVARCHENLKNGMNTLGVQELLGTDTRFKLSFTDILVLDDDTQKIPEAYKSTEVVSVTTVDKKRIKEDLKLGVAVSGAELKQNSHVRIYNRGVK